MDALGGGTSALRLRALCYSPFVVQLSCFRKAPIGLFLLLIAVSAGVPCPAGDPAEPVFLPDPEAEDAPVLSGSTWTQAGDDYAIHLQQIDDDARLAYITKATGLATDPFANRPDQPARFISFLLQVENLGESALELNPVHSWLSTNRPKIQRPIGLTDLAFEYRVAGSELPPAFQKVKPFLLDQPRSIGPGQSTHGLLVYRAVDPKTKTYHVDVQLSLPDGNVVRFAAPYRRVKAKKGSEEK